MLLVVSPAKKLDMAHRLPFLQARQPLLLDEATQLVTHLRALSSHQLGQLMKLSDKLARLNHARFRHWQAPFDTGNATHALAAFQGDVYQALDAATLNDAQLGFAADHVRILSGLYGVLRPDDLMQAYRLEMGTRLARAAAMPGVAAAHVAFFQRFPDLYSFWREKITNLLVRDMQQQSTDTLINLASQEYFRAVDVKHITGRVITPVFKEAHGGTYRVIGIHAKRARGLMAREIITRQWTEAEELRAFTAAGYCYCADLSSASEWVFVRD